MSNTIKALPEVVVAAREDETGSGQWTIRRSTPKRGDVWMNAVDRIMSIPTGDTPSEDAMRAHEMVHARYSPHPDKMFAVAGDAGIDMDFLKIGEEYRVNAIMRRLGFSTDVLIDHTEGDAGVKIATEGTVRQWNEAVKFAAAVAGGKAFDEFLDGLATIKPEWSAKLRQMGKDLATAESAGWTSGLIGSEDGTEWAVRELCVGIIKPLLLPEPPEASDDPEGDESEAGPPENLAEAENEDDFGGDESKVALGFPVSAPVVLATPELTVALPPNKVARRERWSDKGSRPGNPARFVTDPHKRIMRRRQRQMGGVILFDLSGSMSLTNEQVQEIIETAPAATVIGCGYRSPSSHIMADSYEAHAKVTPNTVILAKDGRRVADVNDHRPGGGNGNDLAALKFAISRRRTNNDPIVWVTDGGVWGIAYVAEPPHRYIGCAHSAALWQEMAAICRRYRVTVVPTPAHAIMAIKGQYGRGVSLLPRGDGQLADYL